MSKLNFYKTILSCLFCFLTGLVIAQNKMTASAGTDKNKILIGERIKLTLETAIPAKETVRFFTIDSIPHFEIVAKEKIDTSKTATGILLKQVIQLTSFDSGHWVIPPFFLNKKIKTNPIPVDVVFSDFDPGKDYHDIKDIIEVSPAKEKEWWWYIVAGGMILVMGVVWIVRRKKKPVTPVVQAIDPYQEAMQRLGQIQKEPGSTKQYYSGLVDVFRLYIFRKKGIHSLQKTTDDLILRLRSLNLNKEQFEQLSQALRLSDFVKFAKYIPAKEDDQVIFDTIKRSIQSIEQMNA